MTDSSSLKPSVAAYYDASASNYHEQYERQSLSDTTKDYPANYFRLQLLLNLFTDKGVKRAIEVGVGEGTPLTTLGKAGVDVYGFDISEQMVQKSKATMQQAGMNPANISWGDIQDPLTYAALLGGGQFDALLAMGVMPHVRNDHQVLKNMGSLVRPGGTVFIEFRNKLFSLFTFNRYTYEFIMDDLLAGVAPELKKIVGDDLKSRLAMDKPTPSEQHAADESAPGYDAILSKFHNPLEIRSMFEANGFTNINLLWYHYHPGMPFLESKNAHLYRQESLKLEHDVLGWRGLFLCSAFVVEAQKI